MLSISLSLCVVLLQDATQDDLQDLKDRVEALERKNQELEKRQAQTVSANPQTVLNPTITVIGNFLWRIDNRDVVNDDGDEIDDTANLREVEVDMRAAIDPYADGVAILALESEAPGEVEVGVEEFLIKIKSLPLPVWDEPPLGTQIVVGRMRTAIGTNNVLHLHDLPQSTRPIVYEEFFGEEGHIGNGISAKMFLPSPGDTALQLTVQALQGGGIEVATDRTRPCYVGNLSFFAPLHDEHSINVALIGLYGTVAADAHKQSRVVSLDAWYRWKPLRQGDVQSLIVGAQVFKLLDHEFEIDTDGDGLPDADGETKPLGWYVWAQYQVSARVYAGVRYDSTEFLDDDFLDRQAVQAYASWYMTEFFRVRASFTRTTSDDPAADELNTFLLEVNVVFGAHPPEPFWVSK